MKFFSVTSLDDCKKLVEERIKKYALKKSNKNTADAVNFVLAEDVKSPDFFPPYTRSTVDGFAIRAEDAYCSSASNPAFLRIKGKILMGEMPTISLEKGEAIQIATGGVLPEGANAVVMVENVEELDGELAVYSPVKQWENTVLYGEEVKPQDVIAKRGEVVTPLMVGVFSSVGIERVDVYDKIKVAIISTGDELVSVSEKAENGKIRDVNTSLLAAMLVDDGYRVVSAVRISDNEKLFRLALNDALEKADIVLVSGGSSIGAKDLTEKVLSSGEILLHGLALKPGKPTIVAGFGEKTVFGLPGNPFAALCVFQTICHSVVKSVRGEKQPFVYAYAATNFPSSPGRTTLQPVSIDWDGEKYLATPIFLKSAHLYSALKADGFVVLPETAEGMYSGTLLKVYPFSNKGIL